MKTRFEDLCPHCLGRYPPPRTELNGLLGFRETLLLPLIQRHIDKYHRECQLEYVPHASARLTDPSIFVPD